MEADTVQVDLRHTVIPIASMYDKIVQEKLENCGNHGKTPNHYYSDIQMSYWDPY